MDNRQLETLLRAAGGMLESPPPRSLDLAGRVRRLHRRRQRRRLAIVAAGVMATAWIGAAVWVLRHDHGPGPELRDARVVDRSTGLDESEGPSDVPTEPERLSSDEVERLLAKIARLDTEVQRRRSALSAILPGLQPDTRIASLDPVSLSKWENPLARAEVEIEKSAFLLVDRGDQLSATSGTGPAAREYRRALQWFPHTHAAEAARNRLAQLPIDQGDR